MKKSINLKIFAVLFLICGTTLYAQTTPPNQNKPQKSNQTKRRRNTEEEVQEQLAKQAKVKLEDARETALNNLRERLKPANSNAKIDKCRFGRICKRKI